jgi:hypothetical protein
MKRFYAREFIVSLIVFSLPFFTVLCHAYTYELEKNLPPLSLTYKNLNEIITGLRSLLPEIPKELESYRIEKIQVSGGNIRVVKERDLIFSEKDRIPFKSTSFSYDYYCPEGKITRIYINFADYRRTISVSGLSPDSVDAIFAYLDNKFMKFVTVGGYYHKVFLALFFLGFLLFVLYRWGLVKIWMLPASTLLSFPIVFLSSSDSWLPAFAVYTDSASFFVRNTLLVTYLSFLFPIVALIISFFLKKKRYASK